MGLPVPPQAQVQVGLPAAQPPRSPQVALPATALPAQVQVALPSVQVAALPSPASSANGRLSSSLRLAMLAPPLALQQLQGAVASASQR